MEEIDSVVNPARDFDRFDTANLHFNELKAKIDEDFLPYIFSIFNALGRVNFTGIKNITQDDRESRQYLTLKSI